MFKRKRISKTIWLIILGVITTLILLSTFSTLNAYQQPTTSTEMKKIVTYTSYSQFNYVTNLIDNTVYNKSILRPGEGIIFKQIVHNITGSHQYQFQINKTASISATYYLTAIIQTDLWTKTYTLVPSRTINITGKTLTIAESFPIDYNFYDTILNTINSETGINAPSPILLIRAHITVNAQTGNYTIKETMSPEITMTLNQKTIMFSDFLSLQQSGSKTKIVTIQHPEVIESRQSMLYTTIGIVVILIMFLSTTKIHIIQTDIIEKELLRINRKYSDFLVKTNANPVNNHSKIITISTMEQLSRISEDLGKPMIHYQKNESTNIYIVIDNEYIYQYELQVEDIEETTLFSFIKKYTHTGKTDKNQEIKEEKKHNLCK